MCRGCRVNALLAGHRGLGVRMCTCTLVCGPCIYCIGVRDKYCILFIGRILIGDGYANGKSNTARVPLRANLVSIRSRTVRSMGYLNASCWHAQ